MSKPRIRVAIVDDHPGVRAGIARLLSAEKDIVIVGEGANGAEAIRLAQTEEPDVLLLDVEMPVMRGDEVARRIREIRPKVKVLAVSSHNDRLYIQGMMENGAVGYITKDEAPEFLLEAVRSIVTNEMIWVSPRASQRREPIWRDQQTLTLRELEILRRLAKGHSNQEISLALNISEKLLENYIQILRSKLGLETTEELGEFSRRTFPPDSPES
jgi:DNA-binding NarL/FixJ family response regulator